MSGALALQAAVVAALRAAPGIAGVAPVLDGAPADAALPHIVFGEGQSSDWGSKTFAGREHRLTIVVRDEAGRIARLQALAAAAEAAVAGMARDLPGGRIASIALLRTRLVRAAKAPWSAVVEQRVRVVEG